MNESPETVSPEAVSATIFRALANARTRGEPWKGLAEQHLGRADELLRRTEALGIPKVIQYAEVVRNVDGMDRRINVLLDTITESLWDNRGRDPQDPLISILSPGTPSYFFEWPIGHACDRVEAILELIAPSIAQDSAEHGAASEVRSLVPKYRALCEQMRAARSRVDMLTQMRTSFARLGHVQYSRLRRRMRADGFDSDEIRGVFPDVPGQANTTTFI